MDFSKFDKITSLAVDYGGTLVKIIYVDSCGIGQLKFFDSREIEEMLSFMKEVMKREKITKLSLTGGGAISKETLFRQHFSVNYTKWDEMDCLVCGVIFLLQNFQNISYKIISSQKAYITDALKFPFLLVNIGSGVSILKIDSLTEYSRISGSSIGGGTFRGLMSLIAGKRSFDSYLEMSDSGDNKKVDLLVGDIYGHDYSKIGLKNTTIASSLGKAIGDEPHSINDVSTSILYMISNNIGQLAYFCAKNHGINRVFFSGFFIREHMITMKSITFALDFWSNEKVESTFLDHEGYVGALGCLVLNEGLNKNNHL